VAQFCGRLAASARVSAAPLRADQENTRAENRRPRERVRLLQTRLREVPGAEVAAEITGQGVGREGATGADRSPPRPSRRAHRRPPPQGRRSRRCPASQSRPDGRAQPKNAAAMIRSLAYCAPQAAAVAHNRATNIGAAQATPSRPSYSQNVRPAAAAADPPARPDGHRAGERRHRPRPSMPPRPQPPPAPARQRPRPQPSLDRLP
jgi:hypothetical protein